MKNMRKTIAVAVAVLALTLSMASMAFAQSSVEGYNPNDGAVQNQIQSADTTKAQPAKSSGSSLPFTGLDIALLAGAGGVLLALGLGMRRLTRAPESA